MVYPRIKAKLSQLDAEELYTLDYYFQKDMKENSVLVWQSEEGRGSMLSKAMKMITK